MRAFVLSLLVCIGLVASEAWAGYDEGVAAYKKGDFSKAFYEFERFAKGGNAPAQLFMGVLYDKGEGVQRDEKAAAKWYRVAAEQGNTKAQFNLGTMYTGGVGVQRDDALAEKWLRLAAEQGHVNAQNSLGAMYSLANGVPQDYAESIKWYRLAANQGDADAQFNLGAMHAIGLGVPRDFGLAVIWFRLAADHGNDAAQGELGVMYANGSGVPESRIAAYALFSLCIANQPSDHSRIADNLAKVKDGMVASEIADAEALKHEMAKPGNLLKALDLYVTQLSFNWHRMGLLVLDVWRQSQNS